MSNREMLEETKKLHKMKVNGYPGQSNMQQFWKGCIQIFFLVERSFRLACGIDIIHFLADHVHLLNGSN
jgi:hypothetical protein